MSKPEHILGISSTRPELLFKQISSFILNAEFYQILGNIDLKFLVIDDTLDKSTQFEDEISKLNKYFNSLFISKNAQIIYLSFAKQIEYIQKIKNNFKSTEKTQLNQTLEYFLKDYGSTKYGGIRGVQNKTDLFARLISSSPKSIIHKIDDDIYALSLEVLDNTIKIHYGHNFFGQRTISLGKKNIVTMAGATYSGDSPSHIADLFDGIKILKNFFFLSQNVKNFNENWKHISRIVTPSASDYLIDPLNLINTPLIKQNESYKNILILFADLTKILFRGNCRFIYSDANYFKSAKWFGKRDFVPGGCVSYKNIKESCTPSFVLANQDILTSYYVSVKNKSVVGDIDVLHLKNFSNRLSIVDDLKSKSKHDFETTYQLYKLISKDFNYEENFNGHRSLSNDFFNNAKLMVEETLRDLKELLRLLHTQNAWWNSPEIKKYTSIIVNECSNLDLNSKLLLKSVTYSETINQEYQDIYTEYKELSKYWDSVVNDSKKLRLFGSLC